MPFWSKYLETCSWAKSLLLKSGVLGLGFVAVLWAGWPQPEIIPVAHSPSLAQAATVQQVQHESTPVSSISNNEFLRASTQGVNLQAADVPSLVNLNISSQKELESLPGIGKTLAGRIVTYRSTYGAFQRINDLVKVSGIGEKRLQRLLPYVTVESKIGDL